jgi:hypothetical protein
MKTLEAQLYTPPFLSTSQVGFSRSVHLARWTNPDQNGDRKQQSLDVVLIVTVLAVSDVLRDTGKHLEGIKYRVQTGSTREFSES